MSHRAETSLRHAQRWRIDRIVNDDRPVGRVENSWRNAQAIDEQQGRRAVPRQVFRHGAIVERRGMLAQWKNPPDEMRRTAARDRPIKAAAMVPDFHFGEPAGSNQR